MPSDPRPDASHTPPPVTPPDGDGAHAGPAPQSDPHETHDAHEADQSDEASAPHALPARSMLSGINVRAALSALVPVVIAGAEIGRWFLALFVVALVVTVIARVVHWLRFRWGFDGQVLHVHSGLFWRQRRAMDIGRIQQVEVERPILHRVLGTALMRVETASESGQTEVQLNGLDADEAEALRDAIVAARRARTTGTGTPSTPAVGQPPTATGPEVGPARPGVPPPPVVTLAEPGVADLVRHAVTGSSLLVVPAALAALGQFVFEFAGNRAGDLARDAASTAAGIGFIALALVFLVIGLVGAVTVTLLRDWDLVLVRDGEDLRLSRGLLEQRSTTVPLHRLQVLEYRQNWVRALFGVGTLQLRSAGGGSSDQERRIILPWVDREQLDRVLAIGLREIPGEHELPEPVRHPIAARRRLGWLWLRGLWIPLTLLAITPLTFLADQRGPLGIGLAGAYLLTGVLAWSCSRAQYRRLGHAATDRVALVTGGVVGHTATWMPLGRLQGVLTRANPFQRRLDLVTLVLAPAGAGNRPVDIRDVDATRGDQLGSHLLQVAAGRVSPVAPVDRPSPA